MFESLGPMPPDSILGLMEAFREDPRSGKIDLGVGVYKDAKGETPVLSAVKKAEALRLETESTKSYIGPAGAAALCCPRVRRIAVELLLGAIQAQPRRGQQDGVVQAHAVVGVDVLEANLPVHADDKDGRHRQPGFARGEGDAKGAGGGQIAVGQQGKTEVVAPGRLV